MFVTVFDVGLEETITRCFVLICQTIFLFLSSLTSLFLFLRWHGNVHTKARNHIETEIHGIFIAGSLALSVRALDSAGLYPRGGEGLVSREGPS